MGYRRKALLYGTGTTEFKAVSPSFGHSYVGVANRRESYIKNRVKTLSLVT